MTGLPKFRQTFVDATVKTLFRFISKNSFRELAFLSSMELEFCTGHPKVKLG